MEAQMQFSTQLYYYLMGQSFVIKIVDVSKIPCLTLPPGKNPFVVKINK
jgi:hypothetical protein